MKTICLFCLLVQALAPAFAQQSPPRLRIIDEPVKEAPEEWRGVKKVVMTLYFPVERIRENGWPDRIEFSDSLRHEGGLLLGVEVMVYGYRDDGLLQYRTRNVLYRGIKHTQFYSRDAQGIPTDTVYMINGAEIPPAPEHERPPGTTSDSSGVQAVKRLFVHSRFENDSLRYQREICLSGQDTLFTTSASWDPVAGIFKLYKQDGQGRPLISQHINQRGDIIYHKKWDYSGSEARSTIHEFRYRYDDDGHWIKCVNFVDGEFVSVYGRDILSGS